MVAFARLSSVQVAPVRERGLKCLLNVKTYLSAGRSREGAWIEIASRSAFRAAAAVAPVRERGLK